MPGNHDHELLAPWLERRARDGPPPPLGLETAVDGEPEEALGELAGWLAPARVRAAYPGVWLRDDVYATHGHYADLHLTMPTLERLAAGVMGRIVGLRRRRPAQRRGLRGGAGADLRLDPRAGAADRPRASAAACTAARSAAGTR